jgi:ABC-type uncharacterized transport system ATPase subunit
VTPTTWSATPLAVECRGLTYRFGSHTAVDGIELCVRPGEVFGLLGANGAGKTTTIRVVTTLLPVEPGRVRVSRVNPLGYEVEGLRHLLIGTPAPLLVDFAVVTVALAAGVLMASALLGRLAR